jgi:hypothetical protein
MVQVHKGHIKVDVDSLVEMYVDVNINDVDVTDVLMEVVVVGRIIVGIRVKLAPGGINGVLSPSYGTPLIFNVTDMANV